MMALGHAIFHTDFGEFTWMRLVGYLSRTGREPSAASETKINFLAEVFLASTKKRRIGYVVSSASRIMAFK